MAWTTPGTAVAGAVLEASLWNSDVRDNTLALYAQSQYPYRNLIYNGAMQITQRAAVGSAQTGKTSTGFYTADRFQHVINANGTWTDTTIAEAPTASGFRNSYKTECTTADASPAAGDYSLVRQQLEGQDLQRILKGTSSAQPLVLTFWVRSNLTGTYIVELEDVDNTRSISKAYTINASATWEKKEIAFGADTTGAFDNDNAASLALNFWLSAGSTYTSGALATSWGSVTSANRAVGQVNLAGATSRYWQITGVQLEVGSVSTPYEFLPFETDLAKCQRYWQQSYLSGVVAGTSTSDGLYDGAAGTNQPYGSGPYISYNVTMRATPIVTLYTEGGTLGQARWDRIGAGAETVNSSVAAGSPRGFSVQTSSLVQNRMNVRGHYIANAEL